MLLAWLSCSLAVQVPLHGQERLDAAKITSRAVRKNVPSLGLPSHVREMVEEMTAAKHLCPVQESGWAEPEEREYEMEYDREEDYRERG